VGFLPTDLRRAPPRWLVALLTGLLIVAAGHGTWRVWADAGRTPALRAADALPVYLSGAAVADGEDPTTQRGLKAAYDRREMTVRAATFSNLYPASTGVLLQPIARGTWEEFVVAWRALLLLGAVIAGAAGGLAAARGPWAPVAGALGAWLAVAVFPVTAECVALGQANLLVGGLMGAAMLALSRTRPAVAGVAAILGAGIKLVPGFVVWPLLAARSRRGVLAAGLAGLTVLGATLAFVPMDRVLIGVKSTLQFQSVITPDWMNHGPVPAWVRFAGDLRHTPLMVWTTVLSGVTALGVGATLRSDADPALRARSGAVLAGGVALAAAWLGADSAAFHVLYAPLYLPAVAWLAAWPLDRDAPRVAWLGPIVALLPALLYAWAPGPEIGPEARLVLAGLGLWVAVGARLVHLAGGLPRWGWLAMGLAMGWGAARAQHLSTSPAGPPPHTLPAGDPTGAGLPTGVGHGGVQPGGGTSDGGPQSPAGPGSSAVHLEEVLNPAAASALTGHLVQSPRAWATIDDPLAQQLSVTAPVPPAAMLSYGELVRWLAWEAVAVQELPEAGAQAKRLQRTLSQVEAAGPRR
jgi:hypothetical protein